VRGGPASPGPSSAHRSAAAGVGHSCAGDAARVTGDYRRRGDGHPGPRRALGPWKTRPLPCAGLPARAHALVRARARHRPNIPDVLPAEQVPPVNLRLVLMRGLRGALGGSASPRPAPPHASRSTSRARSFGASRAPARFARMAGAPPSSCDAPQLRRQSQRIPRLYLVRASRKGAAAPAQRFRAPSGTSPMRALCRPTGQCCSRSIAAGLLHGREVQVAGSCAD
jgi:hypothetical protein